MSGGISTHVLDTTHGCPAEGVRVRLLQRDPAAADRWVDVGGGSTAADGRCGALAPATDAATYRLEFDVGAYFAGRGARSIFPTVEITFECKAGEKYHMPLLVNPYSYTTYRGQ